MRSAFLIIADDLSGGMNIGVEFATAGLRTVLVQHVQLDVQADVLIVDTETRNETPETAYRMTHEAAEASRHNAAEIVVKKIDSLLRGSIWQEISAVRDVLGFDRCLLAAASPRLKRTTVKGCVYVDGELLEAARLRVDPSSKVSGSYIPAVLGDVQAELLDLEVIRQGKTAIQTRIQETGSFLLVADCTEQSELNEVVAAAYSAGIRFFAGTYGLGEALCRLDRTAKRPLLVVVGSLSSPARRQVDYLARRAGSRRVQIEYSPAFFDVPVAEMARRYEAEIGAALHEATCVVFQVSVAPNEVQQLWEWAAERGLDARAVSERVDALMKATLEDLLPNFGGFVATGGATANSLFQMLAADAVSLDAVEVLPGTPGARLVGGDYDGLPFIAKPGSQGDDDALARLVDCARRAATDAQ